MSTKNDCHVNPYPSNSVAGMFWDKWVSVSKTERDAFVASCEAMPPAAMHGTISTEWDVVSHIVRP